MIKRKEDRRFIYLVGKGVLLLMVLAYTAAHAQGPVFNLNTTSGLPSNHIYGSTVDHLGYLWIATPKGVVRYNGYETKVFTVTEGLPTEDVWNLVEDRSGRLWLGNMSNEMGYIKNGHYQAVVRDNRSFLYPINIERYEDGIFLLNNGALKPPLGTWEFILYSDKGLQRIKINLPVTGSLTVNRALDLIAYYGNSDSTFFYKGRIKDGKVVLDEAKSVYNKHLGLLRNSAVRYFNNYLCFTPYGGRRFQAISLDPEIRPRDIDFLANSREVISFSYPRGDSLYVASSENVYLFDSTLQLLQRYPLAALTGGVYSTDHNLKNLFLYLHWGAALGTYDKGLYLSHPDDPKPQAFRKRADIDLKGYRFLGNVNDSTGMWWSSNTRIIKLLYAHRRLREYPLQTIDIQRMISYKKNIVLFTHTEAYQLDISHHGKLSLQLKPYDPGIKAIVACSDTLFYITGGAYYSLVRYTGSGSTVLGHLYYGAMSFDAFRHGIWLYRNQQITFYDINKNSFKVWYPKMLQKMGLKKIESIVADKYGNVLIKDYDRLFLFDDRSSSVKPLYTHHLYGDAQVSIKDDNLVVAGRFGLLCSRILGRGRFSKPMIVENVKNGYYNAVYDLQVTNQNVILNTDRGVYEMPLSFTYPPPDATDYRFIVGTPDTTRCVVTGDTVLLPAGAASLQIDVINPKGNGKLRLAYAFAIRDGGKELPGKEINIGSLKPGRFHHLRIMARDEVWQSEPLVLALYIQPHWWQTTSFSLGLAALALALGYFIVIVTRRIVLRQQARQRMMLEMGMAGIHAQINPHFIFNSLTTTQYFIKANKIPEAYAHINRFSRLLRNFLQASKHKYISIGEEVGHLHNYIELQQSRFEKQFDYRIDIDSEIDRALEIPSLLLQPLVENAIQHGLFNKREKGYLRLSFAKEQDKLVIEIEDDGIGRERARELRQQEPARESFGSDLVNKLVLLFNKYERTKIDLIYIDKILPQTGTLVKITIHPLA